MLSDMISSSKLSSKKSLAIKLLSAKFKVSSAAKLAGIINNNEKTIDKIIIFFKFSVNKFSPN